MNRRGFLAGILSLAAAPAIVRASSIMPIKPVRQRVLTMHETKEILAANILNEPHSRISDPWGNSVELYGELNEASLETAFIELRRFLGVTGEKLILRPTTIYHPDGAPLRSAAHPGSYPCHLDDIS